jgi:hypothetical protein
MQQMKGPEKYYVAGEEVQQMLKCMLSYSQSCRCVRVESIHLLFHST